MDERHRNEWRNAQNLNLEVASSAVEVEMQVLNFSKFRELVMDVFLCSFFMYARHKDDPTFNSYNQENTSLKIIPIVLEQQALHL